MPTTATDIQQLVYRHWLDTIELPLGVPLYTAEAASNLSLPYAVAEYVGRTVPIGRGRWMAESDARITVYAASERTIEAVFVACGLRSIVPTGFHRTDIGDTSIKATSRISEAGLPRAEPDPPLGGGRAFSRVITLAVRTGTKD
jgi:hypothetical protein